MSKKSSKSNYRAPTRSEQILAIVGLIVIISMILSALALDFGPPPPVQPTQPAITIIFATPDSPTATPLPSTASGPASPTPGQAPAPSSP